jgi:hypothetical protein
LDQQIKRGHGECESGLEIRPGPVHDLFEVALRHEVARLIVWHVVATRPVVPSAVSYEDVREGNDPYRAFGHGTHSHSTGTRTVRGRCLCQHQAETGLDGWYGEHRCTLDKGRNKRQAKDAERLGPKGHWSGYRVLPLPGHGQPTLPANREHLTHSCQPCGTW